MEAQRVCGPGGGGGQREVSQELIEAWRSHRPQLLESFSDWPERFRPLNVHPSPSFFPSCRHRAFPCPSFALSIAPGPPPSRRRFPAQHLLSLFLHVSACSAHVLVCTPHGIDPLLPR